jgi:hypothetical protein
MLPVDLGQTSRWRVCKGGLGSTEGRALEEDLISSSVPLRPTLVWLSGDFTHPPLYPSSISC